ncbi:MAG: type II toxin-antitoxin system PemK/MazF family toxin [Steroidobacteraceae bacterium]
MSEELKSEGYAVVRGHEQSGHRPVLILSHDIFNARSGTIIAVALTSQVQKARFPLTLELKAAEFRRPTWAKISQIRTLSAERIGKRLCRIPPSDVAKVIEGFIEILGQQLAPIRCVRPFVRLHTLGENEPILIMKGDTDVVGTFRFFTNLKRTNSTASSFARVRSTLGYARPQNRASAATDSGFLSRIIARSAQFSGVSNRSSVLTDSKLVTAASLGARLSPRAAGTPERVSGASHARRFGPKLSQGFLEATPHPRFTHVRQIRLPR